MKQWLKTKLKKFLEIDSLESKFLDQINKFENHEKSNQFQINNLSDWINTRNKELKNEISHFQESVNTLHNTVENVVHIGTDVRQYPDNHSHSWAVVCVEGKMNIVKFVDLDRKDAREIFDFLKHFEAGRHCVDAVPNRYFYEGLFKF